VSVTTADPHGRTAKQPTQIPKTGWKDVAVRTIADVKGDNATLLSAGVAFYSLLALVPALVALVSIYGLVADPTDVERQVSDLLGAAPREVRELIESQLESVVEGSSGGIGLATIAGIAVALWSASSGMKNLMTAINVAYDEEETRRFLKLRAVSLVLTLGAIVFLVLAFAVVALLPSLLAGTDLAGPSRVVIGVLRWPALALAFAIGLGVVYRYAPNRDNARWQWVSVGALFATVLWIAGSLLFSVYAANFGRYNETYGSLGAIVVVMLWLFLTAFVVILGAEINAETERQTREDTTEGPEKPLGERGATAADTVGPTAEQVRAQERRGSG
jgi:membrane protein